MLPFRFFPFVTDSNRYMKPAEPDHRDGRGRFAAGGPGGPGRKPKTPAPPALPSLLDPIDVEIWTKQLDAVLRIADELAANTKLRPDTKRMLRDKIEAMKRKLLTATEPTA